MNKENKKKLFKFFAVIVILLVIILLFVSHFRKTEWVMERGMRGEYSKETYLESGTAECEYDDDMRIYYSYIISSGSMCFQLTNENGEIVYNMVVDESCEGYIYMSDIGSGVFYDHEFALSEDTKAISYTEIQRKRSNWEKFLNRLRNYFQGLKR